jgi:hypothetical protein
MERTSHPVARGGGRCTDIAGDWMWVWRPVAPGSLWPLSVGLSPFQQRATMAPDILFIRHIDLHLLFSRARKEYSRASVALAETRAARSPQAHRRQEVTFSASKEKRAGGPPVAAARGFRRLNDGSPRIGAIAPPSKTEPGVSVPDRPQVREHCPGGRPDPFLRTPRSLAACGGGLGNGPTCFGKPDI